MLEKLRSGKWAHEKATAEEVGAVLEKIRGYVAEYGWEKRKVCPYSYWVYILDFLDSFDGYEHFTSVSKSVALSEINGCIDIVNGWLEKEKEEKVKVRMLTGKKVGLVKEVPASLVDEYVDSGLAEIV